MPIYTCTNCDKQFKLRGNYIRHMQRKNPCNKKENIDISTIKNKSENTNIECNYGQEKCKNDKEFDKQYKPKCKIKKQDDGNKMRTYNKLLRELEKLKKDNKDIKKENRHMKKEINMIKNKKVCNTSNISDNVINNTVNNNITSTNTNNITIVAHGLEDLSKLDNNIIKRAVGSGYDCVLEAAKLIHFNDKYPEFKNIYIKNMAQPYCMVYNGSKWIMKDKTEAINDLYSSKYYFIEENFENFYDSLFERQKKALNDFIKLNIKKNEDDDDDNRVKQIKRELKLLLYNRERR